MEKKIEIQGRIISETSKPYLVAEIGLNHNNDIELAKKIVLNAKESGADAVKFQTYITEKLISSKEDAFAIFKNLELSKEDHEIIFNYCKKIGITFFSTPFCMESIDLLEKLGAPCYKIASMDINYLELIEYAAKTGKPIILSTGMSSFEEIEKAILAIKNTGNNKIVILHTISKYPPEYSEMNMKMISKLRTEFDLLVGFSDHTNDNIMAVVARTFGAVLYEKHFTIDKNLEGPDHSISMTPDGMIEFRRSLDAVDSGLAEHSKKRGDSDIQSSARRSLYASMDLLKGTIMSKEMISIIRPAKGLTPSELSLIIGKKLIKDIKKDDLIDLSCV